MPTALESGRLLCWPGRAPPALHDLVAVRRGPAAARWRGSLAAGWLTEVLDVGDFAVPDERRVGPAVRRLLGPDLDHPVGHHDRDDLAAALLPFGPPADDRGTGRRQAVSPTGRPIVAL